MGWKLGKRQQTLLSDPQCLVHGLGEGEREGMGSFCLRSTSPSLGLRCGCWRNGEGGQISSISHKKTQPNGGAAVLLSAPSQAERMSALSSTLPLSKSQQG